MRKNELWSLFQQGTSKTTNKPKIVEKILDIVLDERKAELKETYKSVVFDVIWEHALRGQLMVNLEVLVQNQQWNERKLNFSENIKIIAGSDKILSFIYYAEMYEI